MPTPILLPRARLILAIGLAILLGLPAAAQPKLVTTTAFVNVDIVPMDRHRVLRDQTVIVADGRIAAIGRRLKPPAGARIVDGRGAYLMPGLADMHSHSRTRADMAVYLANGVTTLLNMGEADNGFAGRTRIAVNRGDVPGPQIFTSLVVDGSPQYGHLVTTNADEARAAVQVAKANGYSFIKVYANLSAESFAAVAAAARDRGLGVVGHNVTALGLARQLAGGQSLVAHLEEFLYGFFPDPPAGDPNAPPDDERIADAIAVLKRHGAFVTADLANYARIAEQFGRPDRVRAYLTAAEARYVTPDDRVAWLGSGYQKKSVDLSRRVAFLGRFVKALADAGVPIVTGTDAPSIPGAVPGYSLHHEFELLKSSGLTRFQILSAATRTPGVFIATTLPGSEAFGTVAIGHRADLLLLRANPLDDLATLRNPLGVMVGGRWHSRAELAAMLTRISTNYDAAACRDDACLTRLLAE